MPMQTRSSIPAKIIERLAPYYVQQHKGVRVSVRENDRLPQLDKLVSDKLSKTPKFQKELLQFKADPLTYETQEKFKSVLSKEITDDKNFEEELSDFIEAHPIGALAVGIAAIGIVGYGVYSLGKYLFGSTTPQGNSTTMPKPPKLENDEVNIISEDEEKKDEEEKDA